MPRKSLAELSIVPPRVDGRPNYVSAPRELSANHRRIFTELVRSMPPEHFRLGDIPLLSRFVAAIAMCELAASKMTKDGGPVTSIGEISAWSDIEQKSARLVAVLATRLRMSPQSRRDPKTVARAQHRTSYYDTIEDDDAEV